MLASGNERSMGGESRLRTVIVVVADNQLLKLAVLAELAPDILVEGVKVVLELGRVHSVLGVVCRVLVEVGHEDRLAVRGLDVLSRAAITVTARADFLSRQRRASQSNCQVVKRVKKKRDWEREEEDLQSRMSS